ncbi:hypothetical protein E2C01_053226 [Portunus trituberculatus]|uniref:Uncharacterized protein n=1 Tax=Portunus trituberculatus TaxID=210409 RepID=A0A5B7GFU6_PORTR|nr:hypothetical protein [Portunus trituberculatus]
MRCLTGSVLPLISCDRLVDESVIVYVFVHSSRGPAARRPLPPLKSPCRVGFRNLVFPASSSSSSSSSSSFNSSPHPRLRFRLPYYLSRCSSVTRVQVAVCVAVSSPSREGEERVPDVIQESYPHNHNKGKMEWER